MKTAVITGVSSGIGNAIALLLLDQNWTIIGLSRTKPDITHKHFTHYSIDLTNENTFITILDNFKNIDAIIHAAGIMASGKIGNLDLSLSTRIWQINVHGAERY
ncbi:SDR family NAD(P)-dependent oxidoreductase [Actinobacillus succinogenes]|uniref:SDR family NAD(P)-dependent oxidoreductase n=1 Tax=Actinobacillus succinogenes TaxID=67854 RepID=UPI00067447B7|nr:SDR family NAD(P)-dependent oxidoreductase [Actinobacillus succinogenes]